MKRPPKQINDRDRAFIEQFKVMLRFLWDPVYHKESEDELNQRLVDLVKSVDLVQSGKPLDHRLNDIIARELELRPPAPSKRKTEKEWRRRRFTAAIALKNMLQRHGLSAGAAEQEVAAEFKISVDTLRKRLERDRKLDEDDPEIDSGGDATPD
jgi:hypothetical protein